MYVLGLDPSLTGFGWALHDTEASGSARCLARGRFETNARMLFVDRLVFLRESLRTILREFACYNPQVGIEQNVFDSFRSADMAQVFAYACEALVQEHLDMVRFSPDQVKAQSRHLINWPPKLDMAKAQMVKAARVDAKGKKWNHNEADAYLIARLAGRFWELWAGNLTEEDLSPEEQHVFTRTHTFVRGKKAGKTERTGTIYREGDRFFLWSKLGALNGPQEENRIGRIHRSL